MNSTRLRCDASCSILWKNCKPTWTLGCTCTTRSGPIRARCAVDERLCKLCLTERLFGRRKSDSSTNLTTAHQNGVYCQIKPKLVQLTRLNHFTLVRYGSHTPWLTLKPNLTASAPMQCTGCSLSFTGSSSILLNPQHRTGALALGFSFKKNNTLTPIAMWTLGTPATLS